MRFWARGGKYEVSRDEQEAHLRAQAEMYGMNFEQFEDVLDRETPAPQAYELYLDNLESWGVFTRSATQWRYGQASRPIGLDYSGLEAMMRMMSIDDVGQKFADVQLMEQAFMGMIRNG